MSYNTTTLHYVPLNPLCHATDIREGDPRILNQYSNPNAPNFSHTTIFDSLLFYFLRKYDVIKTDE